MIVGTAEVLIRPNAAGFERLVKAETAPALRSVGKEAEMAGASAGVGLRTGVTKETGKLGSELEKHGKVAGDRFHAGFQPGLAKMALGLTALEGVGVAAAVKLGEGMQSAEARIAGAEHVSVAAATAIGDALLSTAGKSEFSAQQLAGAFADVAGQMKATEGHALSAKQSLEFMTSSTDLAVAKNVDLGSATKSLANIMQAFQLKTEDAAHASDILYQASNATGVGLDTLVGQVTKVHGKLGDVAGSLGDVTTLLVDMTKQGITGRAAMGALNSGLNTLQKSANGVTTATAAQKAAFDQLPPKVQELATKYEHGTVSAKDFTKATADLSPEQAAAAKAFTTATGAVQKAQEKYKAIGVEVFDAKGKFVGMRDIIDQLHSKFVGMTQQQQLAAAATLFGAGAARQMTAIINAGPAAWDKASAAVNRHGAAQQAAAAQGKTLHREEQVLTSAVSDLATRVGIVLVPAITLFVGWLVKATTFVTQHKAVLIGLATVVTGVLATAIGVFTVNKMAQFAQSFTTASGHVKDFLGVVKTVVGKVIGLFGDQALAAEAMATKTEAATAAAATATETEATAIGTASAATDASFAGTATAADAAAVEVGVAETAVVAEVETADTAIETANVAAGASFSAVLGPLGIAVAAVGGGYLLGQALPGSNVHATPGSRYSGYPQTLVGRQPGVPAAQGGAGPPNLPPPLEKLHHKLGLAGGETYAQQQYNIAHDTGAPGSSFHTNVTARAASGLLAKGQPMTASQRAYANKIIAIGRSVGASPTAIAAVITEAIAESDLGQDMGWNASNPTYGGLLAGSRSNFAGLGGASSSAVTNAETISALKGGRGYVAGGAMGLSRTSSDLLQIAMTNSGSGTQFLGQTGHGAYAGESRAVLAAYGGGARAQTTPTTRMAPAYVDPFAHARGVTRGRTDQGVDFGFSGPLGAIGAGVIEAVKQFAGFGTTIEERLTSGPRKGQLVYTALETGATLATHAGARVAAGQQIAVGKGSGGIETGFAQGSGSQYGLPTTRYGPGQSHDVPTKGGLEFSAFLASIKAGTAGSTTTVTPGALGTTTATKGLSYADALKVLGGDEIKKLLHDAHAGSLKTLAADLNKTHGAALRQLEHDLFGAHSTGLARLGDRVVAAHKAALDKEAQLQAKAAAAAAAKAAAAAETRTVAAMSKADTLATDTANDQASAIADATKVYLDKQAETGQTGAALVAAQAQTGLDQVTQANDAAIGAAQIKVDQAVGGSQLAQAQANAQLAQAQATATVTQAQAQSVLDKATAAAQSAANATSTPGTPTPGVFNFTINGANMTPGQIMGEVAWYLKIGALPVAA